MAQAIKATCADCEQPIAGESYGHPTLEGVALDHYLAAFGLDAESYGSCRKAFCESCFGNRIDTAYGR